MEVHPVGRAEKGRNARKPAPTALRPEDARQLSRRLERWRAHPDLLTRGDVRWSRWASRTVASRSNPAFGRGRALATEEGAPAAAAASLGPPDTIHVAILRVDFLNDRGGSAST